MPDLRANEEHYRMLVENSDDAIYIMDSTGRLRFANNAFPRVFGFSLSEVAQTGLLTRVHAEDIDMVRRAVDGLLRGEPIRNLEYRFRRKDGVWIDLQCSGTVFSRDGDRVAEAQFVVRDNTQARERQQQLLRRNKQLAALTTLAEVANSSLNIDEIARNTLEVALESTGMSAGAIHLADSKQQVLHLYVQSGLPDALAADLGTLKWGEAVPGFVAALGQTVVVDDLSVWTPAAPSLAARHGFRSTIVVPVKIKGELLGTLGLLTRQEVEFTSEVLEMVAAMGNQLGIAVANARLFKDLGRKNELLQLLVEEAHHRIKNNLQMVSGLLQLEADSVQVDSPKRCLQTAIMRIQAIAQVHNLLSEEMPEKVDVNTLITTIVQMLVGSAPRAYGTPEVTTELQPVWLGAEQAVPLALIVNELVSNAFVHGRPASGQSLRVRIQCRQQDGYLELVVADNGGGFAGDGAEGSAACPGDGARYCSPEGQGMSIMAQLAHVNLRGRLQIDSGAEGVRAELRFEIVPHGPGPGALVSSAPAAT
jgi:PAS domain S-box-containing protein